MTTPASKNRTEASPPRDLRPAESDGPAEEPRLDPANTPASGVSNALKIARFALRRTSEKNLTQVASSLTFTTVLGIVPLLAVVLSLFTAFPLFADFRVALESFLSSSLLPPSVSENVMFYLNQFAAKASGLTAVGSLFLIVTSVMLFMTIDEAFNSIWQVERQRPIGQRILVYWAIISLGPILIGASLWAMTVLARESLGHIGDLPAVLGYALSLVPLIATGLGFTALFVGVPNRRVLWRDAAVGGFGTAIVLEIMRWAFAYYLARFPSYTVIYGAFATLPIFLLWLYLSWLAILVGATVAATLPALRQRRWALEHHTGGIFIDALRVLEALWTAQQGQPPGRSMRFLCAHLRLHELELSQVLDALKDLGYVVNAEGDGADQWVLSCDQREADLAPLIDALLLDRGQPGLSDHPEILRAVAMVFDNQAVRLETLFETPELLPEPRRIGQNTPHVPRTGTQEDNDVKS